MKKLNGEIYMFLTRKAQKKIRLLTGAYYVLGLFCFLVSAMFSWLGMEIKVLMILGIISLVLGVLFGATGKYAEGTGKLINSGNKLVFHELRPAEFIRLYQEKRDCPENVIVKPSFDVLRLLLTAYSALGNYDRELEVLDQMLSIASEKQKRIAKLLKSSLLFSIGKVEEANILYNQVLNEKMDLITKGTLDIVMKTDRAIALGDFATAEAYFKQKLAASFPKNTPLSTLYLHLCLGKIYYSTGRSEQAKIHFNYCIENGGETAIPSEASNLLEKM